ncbi:MAG TPA: VWA domain-containing protein [Vicinamibacterales bacterium]|nr:VWA domain-containing protein [Vicinamibacterales bacterium]
MSRIRLAGVFCVALGVLGRGGAAQGQDPQRPPTFRAQASAVSVDVAVRDKSRKPIVDLAVGDFVIEDNNVRQTIDSLSYAKRPIDVTVGLDVSGSVTGLVLERLRQAVAELARGLRDVDRVKLVLFNTQLRRAIDFSSDAQAVSRAMRDVPAGGATALYDTLGAELVAARDTERRQLIMFFTDGIDSGSLTSPQVIQTIAVRARATVTFVTTGQVTQILSTGVIGSSTIVRPTITRPNPLILSPTSLLATVARDTGGEVVPADATTNLGSVFRKILDDFRSSYVLFYSPTGVEKAGFHTITVTVSRPDLVVTARRGYFGG